MKQLLRTLPLIILSFFIFSLPASAFYIQSGNNIYLPQDKVYNETVIIAGNSLTVDSTINGDLVCAGQNITLNGVIKGDIICAGQNIKVNGPVGGDVRLAGQSLDIYRTATITGDLLAAGQSLNFSSNINRDVLIAGEKINFDPIATIGGNLDYYSKSDQLPSISVTSVKGKITQHLLPQDASTPKPEALDGLKEAFSITSKVLSLFSILIVGLFILFVSKVVVNSNKSPLVLFFVGFAVIFLTPILLFILLMTIVGIPLTFIIGLIYLLGFFVAIPLASIALGQIIHPNKIVGLFVGTTIFILLSLLPVFGWFFGLIFLCIGFGLYFNLLFPSLQKY